MKGIVGIVVAIVVLIAIVNSGHHGKKSSAAVPSQAVASRCLKVPINTRTMIDESLRKGYLAGSYRAVRSRDYKAVWFVSARVLSTSPSDNSSTYATWATLDLVGGGNLMGGDQVSLVFTPSLMRLPNANMSDDGLMESQDCSRKAAAAGGS